MAKVYLSPAAHATDNKTKCPITCGENVHCNQYMDIVESRLKELGFEVMRGDKKLTGSSAMTTRVSQANKWKADLYYVAHTNAGGGRYSMTMYYPNAASKAKAEVFHKYRKCISHKIKANSDLYEIKQTAMVCLYDELFFHDNADDCKWFHNSGMKLLAEETVQAICEICNVSYKPHEEPKPEPKPTPAPVKKIAPVITYQAHIGGLFGRWLGKIKGDSDYAGIPGKPITAIKAATDKGAVQVRVHTVKGKYLPWVTNNDVKQDGYAGIYGKNIDAVQAHYVGDSDFVVEYRVGLVGGGYLNWIREFNDVNSMGYAGIYGKAIDRIQFRIVKK